jgi:hypothetical protein
LADRAVSKIVGADLNAIAWAAPMMPVPTTPIPMDCGIAELQNRIVSAAVAKF